MTHVEDRQDQQHHDENELDDYVPVPLSASERFWRRQMDWLLFEMRRCRRFLPYWMEWILSVFIVLGFALKFLVDYTRYLYDMHQLRQSPSQWCRVVPLACLPQTKRQQQTTGTAYKQLVELLHQQQEQDKADSTVFSDDHLVQAIQSSLKARLLASAIMTRNNRTVRTTTTAQDGTSSFPLKQQLERLWPRLMEIYPRTSMECFSISLIVPAYREPWENLCRVLEIAYQRCQTPKSVQVIVVQAGGNKQQQQYDTTTLSWSDVQVVSYTGEGGRGGCMNYGAQHATGTIYTFLHCDTLLPDQWDTLIRAAIRPDNRVNLCAFGFAMDTSQLNQPFPAMHIAAWQARIRSVTCRFPYGDSALTFRATAFLHVGGFPHEQPLMEDYELVRLFRLRAGLMPDSEPIVILPALCYSSPRRYIQYGVYYLALTNWTIVSRYKKGMAAEDLFQMYYQQPAATSNSANDKPKQS